MKWKIIFSLSFCSLLHGNQLLAETLAEEQLQNPDFKVTRIVIQKEGEEINGDVEDETQEAAQDQESEA